MRLVLKLRPAIRAMYHTLSVPIENRVCSHVNRIYNGFENRSNFKNGILNYKSRSCDKPQRCYLSFYPPESEQKSVRVSIIGKPNVGKSTLLNSLLQQYISPVSPLRQTTTGNMSGIVTHEDIQVVFTDTPGIMPGEYKQSRGCSRVEKLFYLQSIDSIKESLESVDVVMVMVDASNPVSKLFITADLEEMLDCIPRHVPKILILNKVDKVGDSAKMDCILEQLTSPLPPIPVPSIATRTDLDPSRPYFVYEEYRKDGRQFDEVVELSALQGRNVNYLWFKVRQFAVLRPWQYPPDTVSPDDIETVVRTVVRAEILTKLGYSRGYRLDHRFIGWKESDGKLIIEHAIFRSGNLLSEEEQKDSKANIEQLLESRFGIPVEFTFVSKWHSHKDAFIENIELDSEPTIEIYEE